MRKADVPNTTWVLSVDPNFLYLVRVHFCDIVSKALNSLALNFYLNSDNVLRTLNLSSITGNLRVPYYQDFVSNSSAGTLTVSVGPDSMAADIAKAILNGLEVFEIRNESRSSGVPISVGNNTHPSSPSKKNNIGIIVGSSVGAVAFMAIIGLVYCGLAFRRYSV
ncbi:receptor-like protein kinase THESEUS 1 [Prunus yedoensis var. nudiflora]|uniref:Receptor-like protein kinase THESEUS 1 n=1 Tax=Prunus yedoensis var. nudiflora TaxID=2094558 RepID=A0A314UBQ1_PRUYE|nr:receptor-like protein kinase THESEUS 1 [Prunus yedoensis var. nudiflora]